MTAQNALAVAAVVGLALAAAYALGLPYLVTDPQRHIDLAAWAAALEDEGHRLLQGSTDATEEVCGQQVLCDQAVRTEHMTLYRFDSVEDAQAYGQQLGASGYQSTWTVLHFTSPDVRPDERAVVQDFMDGTHTSD